MFFQNEFKTYLSQFKIIFCQNVIGYQFFFSTNNVSEKRNVNVLLKLGSV